MILALNKKKDLFKLIKFYYLIIILFSSLISIYYGYRGIFPIDSFIIFSSGHKVLNNFHPFKDYWSITGPLLDYIQAIFFLIFNINWFSYTLHAAILNSILSATCFFFFLNLKSDINFSFLASICISILAYPSIGTPFVDYHAIIFTFLSIIFFILAIKTKYNKYWFFCSFLLILSFFSKQIPAAYFFIFFGILLFLINSFFFKIKKNLIYLLWGGFSGVFIFILIFYYFDIPLDSFFLQYIIYPMSIGKSRIENIDLDFQNTILQFKFIYLALIPIFFLLYKNYFLKKKNKTNIDFLIYVILLISVGIFIYTQLMTKNQVMIFFLVPFILGVSHCFVKKQFENKKLIYFIFFILIFTTLKFHLRFNEEKKFMELDGINIDNSINASFLDDRLKGLKWITIYYPNNPDYELKMLLEAKNLINSDTGNKIIISDYLVLSAITKNSYYSPNKWFDNQSVPKVTSKFFKEYKDFFISSLKRHDINIVYIIGKNKLKHFTMLFSACNNNKQINEILTKIYIKDCLSF